MDPVPFEGANCILKAPVTDTGVDLKKEGLKCEDLHVLKCIFPGNIPAYISCWELSDADIERVVKTRKVWCSVITGGAAPPIGLQTFRPFELLNGKPQ